MRIATATLLTLTLAASAHAQDHDPAHHSPYGGLQDRAVKALSAEEVEGLLAGDGLGFALAAELNGLPGPKHVLEMHEALGLDDEQRALVQAIREAMSEEAAALGRRVVDAETHLDRMFAAGHATAEMVMERTLEIGRLKGELRATHLNAHLETAEVLTPEQITEYGRLRGYTQGG